GRRLPRDDGRDDARAPGRVLPSGPDRAAPGNRVRGARADAGDRARHRQADGRADRGRDPEGAPAGAVQGQGHPLRRRVRAPEGREAGVMATLTLKTVREKRLRRHRRVRGKITGTAERPRLVVFRSNRGIFAQLVDDATGRTIAGASWTGLKNFKGDKSEQAKAVGKELAAAAKQAGIRAVVFDRGGYLYHGRVKALADGAREGGLRF